VVGKNIVNPSSPWNIFRSQRAWVIFVLVVVIWNVFARYDRESTAFAQDQKIRLAWVAISGAQAPIWIAKEQKLFKKYGLDAEITYVASSQTATHALLAGDLDITVNSGNAAVSAASIGQDIVLIAGITNLPVFSLMAKTNLKAADLKGKVIATDKPGTNPHHALMLALKHLNLRPGDIRISPIGNSAAVLAAMEQGIVDVGVISPPMLFKAKRLGYHTVVDLVSLGIPSQGNCITTTRRFIKAHREEVLQFTKALVDAIYIYKTDQETTLKVLEKYTKIQDRNMLEETRRYFALKLIPQIPYPTKEGLKRIVETPAAIDPRISSVNVDQLIDNSFLSELEKSGFIRSLYR
jgi:ABC-type nitrate/sulfonate/bicarbonate transport system substrate-binding protein